MNEEYDGGFFQWDSEKAAANYRKHGINFFQAARVFDDSLVLESLDETYSWDEDRWIALGFVDGLGILVVVWVSRGESVRLISARRATLSERSVYEDRSR